MLPPLSLATSPTVSHTSQGSLRATIGVGIALLAGVGTIFVVNHYESEKMVGVLQAETGIVSAPHEVQIEKILAKEGDIVKPGEIICLVSDARLDKSLQDKVREINRLQGELDQARARTDVELAWRTKALDDELFETRLKLSQYLQQQYDHNMNDMAWEDYLSQQSSVSKIGAEIAEGPQVLVDPETAELQRLQFLLRKESYRNATEVCAAQVEICEDRMKELETLKSELPEKIRSAMGVNRLTTQIEKHQADIAHLEQQRTIRKMTASHHGTVGLFRHLEGELLSAGEPVVELLDQDRRYLEVQVPSRRIAEFEAGTRVSLTFSGGVKRVGEIRSIPPQAKQVAEAHAVAHAADIPVTLIIDPVGIEWPASPIGSTVGVKLHHSFAVR
ncbi:MAG: HlyD family efflux transporter periplasmic adaptor subunit [Planctomycetota bacterium]|nr:HlyD family efflux transporter periplasmic adaptor subunit [Planctomycetota bacterium]MDA1214417.1 HlyD family efflux transporter periplasmic adaptor subunit [Planctomycetota bacterium]